MIRNQKGLGLKMAQRHHRLYRRHQHPRFPWHRHRARESSPSPNDPAMRRRPALSGLDPPQPAEPASLSSIYTRHSASQTSQSRCCSRLPGFSRRCTPNHRLPSRRMSTKPRNPSPGQSLRIPAARLLTRVLVRGFLTYTGMRRKFCFELPFSCFNGD